jgi:hypothetical protein
MSGIAYNPEFADVDNDGYVSGVVSVGATQVEAKVGANRLVGRESLTLTNKGPNKVYFGPSGVTPATGDYLEKNQSLSVPLGESIAMFLICENGQSASVVVQEMA